MAQITQTIDGVFLQTTHPYDRWNCNFSYGVFREKLWAMNRYAYNYGR